MNDTPPQRVVYFFAYQIRKFINEELVFNQFHIAWFCGPSLCEISFCFSQLFLKVIDFRLMVSESLLPEALLTR